MICPWCKWWAEVLYYYCIIVSFSCGGSQLMRARDWDPKCLQCAVSSGTCNCFPQLAQTLPQVPFAPQNQSLPPASATSSTVKESPYRIGGSCINSQHVSGGELSWASHHQRSGLLLMSCLNKCQQWPLTAIYALPQDWAISMDHGWVLVLVSATRSSVPHCDVGRAALEHSLGLGWGALRRSHETQKLLKWTSVRLIRCRSMNKCSSQEKYMLLTALLVL